MRAYLVNVAANVALALEEHPLDTRYVLDGGVWVDEHTLDAADAEVGAAFVRKVASWLEVPVELEPGVPLSASCVRAAPSESVRRVGVETELLSIGSQNGVELLLHIARGVGIAGLEERSPHQRRRVVNVLARGLVGARANTDAAYRGFKRVISEPTPKALGTFAGERLVTARWRQGRSAISQQGSENVLGLKSPQDEAHGRHRHVSPSWFLPQPRTPPGGACWT